MKRTIIIAIGVFLIGCAPSIPERTPAEQAALVQQAQERQDAIINNAAVAMANMAAINASILSPSNCTKNGISDNQKDVYECKRDAGLFIAESDGGIHQFYSCMRAHGYTYKGFRAYND
jgi:hypothetical protein